MSNTFLLKSIFEKSFGYVPEGDFKIEQAAVRKSNSSLGQAFYATDDLGREHYMPVVIEGWLIPFAVVSVTPKKLIVSTPMPERGGSVHEIVAMDDIAINIKGILVSKDNEYPEADLRKLWDIFKLNKSVELKSAKTAIFLNGEDKVIIKEMPVPPVPGVQHAQPFELNCVSDTIYKLEL